MSQFASGKYLTLTRYLAASDTTLYADSDLGVTEGRIFFQNNTQVEWIKFTGKSVSGVTLPNGNPEYQYTGLTRGLSQTADPATATSGKAWLATSIGKLVIMHDQMFDKQLPTQMHQEALTFATTAARDAELGADGVCTYNYTDVKVTATGLFYNYNTTSGQWEVQGTGTATPNASETVSGSVEIGTQTEVDAGTETGGTGAINAVTPKTFQQGITNRKASQSEAEAGTNDTKIMTPKKVADQIAGFGTGIDGDVTITGNVTLSKDMNYNNLTLNSPGVLDTNGYKVFVNGTFSGDGTIRRNGNNGGAGSEGTSGNGGGTAGAVLNQGSLNAEVAGQAGGGTLNGGGAGTAANPSYTTTNGSTGGNGGNGYSGGVSPGQSGGTGGTATRGSYYNIVLKASQILALISNPASYAALNFGTQYKGSAGSGGGGGGGGSQNSPFYGGGGGGSGSNGGTVWISAREINFTGLIECKGGNGGNGATVLSNINGGGGGGGAGGNGGLVYLISRTFTSIGTTTLTGGTGGSGGNGSAGGGNGTAGANGSDGTVIQITI